jgi:uncharacterized membrane protein
MDIHNHFCIFMKKYLFVILGFLIAPCGFVFAEEISRYDIDLTVNADATVYVIETITYDFGSQERRGIYRDIPVRYETRFGDNRSIQIDNVSVVDENGGSYKYVVSQEGKNKQIKIGDAGTYITGKHVYKISYDVHGAINYFDTHDELYWNAIGGGWTVPINDVSVKVHVPQIDQIDCFAGVYGSTKECDSINQYSDHDAAFSQKYVAPGMYMTIVSSIPPGMVYKPTIQEKIMQFIKDNWIVGLPLIVLVFMWRRWSIHGKDPEGSGVIVPQYEAPENLSPAEAGLMYYEILRKDHISALLIDLAVKGYLHIRPIEKKGMFKSADYLFIKTDKNISDHKLLDEKLLYESIFKHGSDRDVKISQLKNSFYKDLAIVMTRTREQVVSKGLYVKNPKSVRAAYISIGVFLFVLGFFIGGMIGFAAVFACSISGVIIGVFGFFMPKRTKKGAIMREKIRGLKLYLETAEKDRINFHNAPEKKPKKFEELLPYAMVLGVEEAWAKQFEGIYDGNPEWYEGSSTSFSPVILAHNMSSLSTAATRTMSSAPSSAGSGSSGFSGGGGGGGFGGGGGGSW